jgi:hypothetical protein
MLKSCCVLPRELEPARIVPSSYLGKDLFRVQIRIAIEHRQRRQMHFVRRPVEQCERVQRRPPESVFLSVVIRENVCDEGDDVVRQSRASLVFK